MQLLLDAFPPMRPNPPPTGVVANPNVNYRIVGKYNYLNQRPGIGKWLDPAAWARRIINLPYNVALIIQKNLNNAKLEKDVLTGKVAVVPARRR